MEWDQYGGPCTILEICDVSETLLVEDSIGARALVYKDCIASYPEGTSGGWTDKGTNQRIKYCWSCKLAKAQEEEERVLVENLFELTIRQTGELVKNLILLPVEKRKALATIFKLKSETDSQALLQAIVDRSLED
jgi:hypothetical protein